MSIFGNIFWQFIIHLIQFSFIQISLSFNFHHTHNPLLDEGAGAKVMWEDVPRRICTSIDCAFVNGYNGAPNI
jgi:hypothetical protein